MNILATCIGWADLVTTVVLAGLIISAVLIGPPSRRTGQVAYTAACVLGVALLLELVLTGLRLHAMARVGGAAFVVDLLDIRWSRLWLVRAVGLAVLMRYARAPSRPPASLAAIWLLARSFQGHAGAHGTLPALIDWLHLLAAVTWLGGLLHYALQPDPIRTRIAGRLRTVSTGALLLLVPAGVYGAFLHVPNPGALVTSPYGRALCGKLLLAAVLIGLGAANHFRYVPALWRNEPSASRVLYRIIIWELAAGLVVLLLSALLGVLPPP